MDNQNPCCGGSNCCAPQDNQTERRIILVEFLYLDLETCDRCQGTDAVLDEALNDVASVLGSAGYDVYARKVKVETEEEAMEHRLVTSPTIRVNGRDIQMDVKESVCGTCSDISGDATDCRVWVYRGAEYTVPPKAMIVEAMLREVFGRTESPSEAAQGEYQVPDNLKRFFAGQQSGSGTSCCGGSSAPAGPQRKTCC